MPLARVVLEKPYPRQKIRARVFGPEGGETDVEVSVGGQNGEAEAEEVALEEETAEEAPAGEQDGPEAVKRELEDRTADLLIEAGYDSLAKIRQALAEEPDALREIKGIGPRTMEELEEELA